MANDIDLLDDKDLEDIREWAQAKRDHYQNLLDRISRRIQLAIQRTLPSPVGASNSRASLGKVHTVMLASGKWLSNKQIRKLLADKANIKLSENGLRVYLREGEHEFFQRQGKSRYTEWKAITVEK